MWKDVRVKQFPLFQEYCFFLLLLDYLIISRKQLENAMEINLKIGNLVQE